MSVQADGIQQVQRGLLRFRAELPNTLRKVLEEASDVIGARAIGSYMRDARDEFISRNPYRAEPRREAKGRPPIRILSGDLARSLAGSRGSISRTGGSSEAIERITMRGSGQARLVKGSAVPYASFVNEAIPFLEPALRDELGQVRQIAQTEVFDAMRRALR